MPFLLRRVLEEANNLQEASKIIETGPRTMGYNYLFADAKAKNAVALETTRQSFVSYPMEGDRLVRSDLALDPLIRDLQLGGRALSEGREKEWATELRDSLGYARSQGGLRQLDHLYVTGGEGRLLLKSLIESAVTAPVTFWNPLNDIPCAPGLSVENGVGPLLPIAIGLALRQPA